MALRFLETVAGRKSPEARRTVSVRTVAVVAGVVLAGAGLGLGVRFLPQPHRDLAAPMRLLSDDLVRLDSAEGQRLLFESEAHRAFLPLATHFVTQKTQTYCGVASIVMVLNALEVPAPAPEEYQPYRLFTQDTVLDELASDVTTAAKVAKYGMSPEHVAGVLRSYGVDATVQRAELSNVDEFRDRAASFLSKADHYVIVNYSRSALAQEGGGHISPLAAYDADTDRFLILDVSRYKYPPVWVDTDQLFEAMIRPIEGHGSGRGFVLIRPAAVAD
jgi:hypothetical protein